jgi:RimJ/RimL family protein N-acetyltransferase
VKLIPVDPANEEHLRVLYELLEERTPEQSISHRRMPTREEHCRFVGDKTPKRLEDGELFFIGSYQDWCLIQNAAGIVGAVYLTRANEIGIGILREFQGHGYGPNAVVMMMMKHGERNYYANINPANEPSRKMFERLGFKTIQHTLALEAK